MGMFKKKEKQAPTYPEWLKELGLQTWGMGAGMMPGQFTKPPQIDEMQQWALQQLQQGTQMGTYAPHLLAGQGYQVGAPYMPSLGWNVGDVTAQNIKSPLIQMGEKATPYTFGLPQEVLNSLAPKMFEVGEAPQINAQDLSEQYSQAVTKNLARASREAAGAATTGMAARGGLTGGTAEADVIRRTVQPLQEAAQEKITGAVQHAADLNLAAQQSNQTAIMQNKGLRFEAYKAMMDGNARKAQMLLQQEMANQQSAMQARLANLQAQTQIAIQNGNNQLAARITNASNNLKAQMANQESAIQQALAQMQQNIAQAGFNLTAATANQKNSLARELANIEAYYKTDGLNAEMRMFEQQMNFAKTQGVQSLAQQMFGQVFAPWAQQGSWATSLMGMPFGGAFREQPYMMPSTAENIMGGVNFFKGLGKDIAGLAAMFSDERLKENIEPINNALKKMEFIDGVEFDWKTTGKHSAGVIAQQIENVMPSAVEKIGDLKTVDYSQIIGLLVQAIKELKDEILHLKGVE